MSKESKEYVGSKKHYNSGSSQLLEDCCEYKMIRRIKENTANYKKDPQNILMLCLPRWIWFNFLYGKKHRHANRNQDLRTFKSFKMKELPQPAIEFRKRMLLRRDQFIKIIIEDVKEIWGIE